MMIFRSIALFVFMVCGTIFSVYSGVAGCAGNSTDEASATFPETCAEIQEAAVDETGDRPANGIYTLYINGDEEQPWEVYCHNMSRAEPVEYLTVDESQNYSQVRDDDSLAETSYRRYRIDPIRLEINPLDDTFADSDFDDFTPLFHTDDIESIPAGWAEVQPLTFNDGTPAESNVSLEGTGFLFDESILETDADEMSLFFCQVNSLGVNELYTDGTGFTVDSDLASFHLTAVNTNSEMNATGITTREVADCENLGTGATDFSEAAWPLQYVGE